MCKAKNIVIVNDFDYIQGGASKVAIDTANLLMENNQNAKVFFFCGAHDDSSTLRKDVIVICTNQGEAMKSKNKITGFTNGLYNRKAKKKLEKLLDTLDPDETIIHVHGWTKSLSSSIFDVAFKKNFKVVLTMHDYFTACPNGGYFNYRKDEKCYLKPMSWNCIKINCDSRSYSFKMYRVLRQFIQNKIVQLPSKLQYAITISDFSEKILKKTICANTKIYRVNNPIDIDENSKRVNYRKNDYYLYVGRVSKEKGTDVFCEAISRGNVRGVVVGDGPELNDLRKKYPKVEFVGWKNGSEVKQYMKGARALVFPSKWYEVAPLTPLEALQYGVPMVVNEKCAAVEYVSKNCNGITFKSMKELSDIMQNGISDKIQIKMPDDNYLNEISKIYNDIMEYK